MRKVFLEDLPKWENGANKNRTNWKESIGYRIRFIYDNIEGEFKIIDYIERDILIKYLDKDVFRIATSGFSKCLLGSVLGIRTKEFKVEIGETLKDNKRNLTITDRKHMLNLSVNINYKWYKYTCNKCGWTEGWIVEGNLLKGNNCSCCSNQKTVLGINSIWDTDKWMVNLGVSEEDAKKYTKCSGREIEVICPNCGKNKDRRISDIFNNKSIFCSCGDGKSYPEKIMFSLLEQLNIDFKTEYSPDWIKPMRYDFYFEMDNEKHIVEMDGSFHKKYNTMSGQTSQKSKDIDDYKDRLALEHNIKVIRVDCVKSNLEFIKNNILNSKLNNTLRLSSINWHRIEVFALDSLVKRICEIKREYPNKSTTDICKITKLGKSTIIKYLKQGTKLGWCDYNPKEEKLKVGKIIGGHNRRKVICLTTGAKFNSATEGAEKYNIDNSRITKCCNGKAKST